MSSDPSGDLWRGHRQDLPRGGIGIFDRSHDEDVGVVRAFDRVPELRRTRHRRIRDNPDREEGLDHVVIE